MGWKRRIQGSLLWFIGFMLSPLSWWNDAFVNLPLAIGFGWLIAWFYPRGFAAAVVIGYWLTNVLGLVLMHKGGQAVFSKGDPRRYTLRQFGRDLLISLVYTGLILILIELKVLKPLTHYFTNGK